MTRGTPDFTESTTSDRAALLKFAQPAALTWDSGALTLTDSYQSILVIVEQAANGDGFVDCRLDQKTAASLSYPTKLQNGGGSSLTTFEFPIVNQIGDTVDVTVPYRATLTQNITNVWVYGQQRSLLRIRSDGYPVPKNEFVLPGSSNVNGEQIYTAPGGGPPGSNVRPLLTRLGLRSAGNAGGVTVAAVQAYIKGVNTSIATLYIATGAAVISSDHWDWPEGLLVDYGTNITLGLSNPGGPATAWELNYDLVAAFIN